MHKNIVLFSDGTGNSSASLFKTNVRRMYEALDLTDPKNLQWPRQFALYDDGVGTSGFRPLAIIGGAVGIGLARNVRDLYAFLCRTYEDGDKIYAFGFSRGAFTIRVLIGLVLDQGLVPYDGDEAALERNVRAAYRAYRRKYKTLLRVEWPLRAMRDAFIDAKGKLLHQQSYRDVHKRVVGDGVIRFLGLWDTVDAYGLPVDELARAVDLFVYRITMRDLDLNPRVHRARHALALDDERRTFHPRLWNEAGEAHEGNRTSKHIDDERICQVWFAGVHANVGGGYAEDSLAHVSLKWMMKEAHKCGLRFKRSIWIRLLALEDESGPIYDSRRGLAGYYRYDPRRIEKISRQKGIKIARTKIHESVLRRIVVGQDGYAPLAPPPGFAVVEIDGTIRDGSAYVGAAMGDGSAFAQTREHAWNLVWWRRVVYFATLATTLVLAAMPLLWPTLEDGACSGSWSLCFLSVPIASVSAVLPAFMGTWTATFASNPGWFLALGGIVASLIWAGTRLEGRIRDRTRLNWYGMSRLNPRVARAANRPPGVGSTGRAVVPFPAPASPGRLNKCVQWLRTRDWYQKSFRALSEGILPVAFLGFVVYGATAMASKAVFMFADSFGMVCEGNGDERRVVDRLAVENEFATSEPCFATGLVLDEGAAYRVRMTIPHGKEWSDAEIAAGPDGIDLDGSGVKTQALMAAAVPLRRHWRQPWFRPIARIGGAGSDFYPLHPKPPLGRKQEPDPAGTVFEAEMVARSGGELFLYVNDVVIPVPTKHMYLYGNNQGVTTVEVERLRPPRREDALVGVSPTNLGGTSGGEARR